MKMILFFLVLASCSNNINSSLNNKFKQIKEFTGKKTIIIDEDLTFDRDLTFEQFGALLKKHDKINTYPNINN